MNTLEELLQLSEEAARVGDMQKAIQLLQELVDREPTVAPFWAALGSRLSECNQYEEANHAFQKAINLDPCLAGAYSGLGRMLMSLGKYAEAEQLFKKSISLKPTAGRYVFLAVTQQRLSLSIDAEQSYKQALVIDPMCEEAYYNLAVLYSCDDNRADEAMKLFREAIRVDPNYSFAYTELGEMLYRQRSYGEAEKILCKAIDLDCTQVWAHVHLANTQRRLGKVSEAENAYRRACDLSPSWALPWLLLATLLLENKRIAEAEEYFRKAVAVEDDADAAYHMGRFLHEHGKSDEAPRWIKLALQLDPQHCGARRLANNIDETGCGRIDSAVRQKSQSESEQEPRGHEESP